MESERVASNKPVHRTLPASYARSLPGRLRSLITVAILANPAAAWADGLPDQHSLDPPNRVIIRTTALNSACLPTSREGVEGYLLMQEGRFAEARPRLQSALTIAEKDGPEPSRRACLMDMIGVAALQERHSDLAVQWFERALELKPLSDAVVSLLTNNLASAYADLDRLERAEELARQAIYLSKRAFGPDHPETLFPQTTLAFIYAARGEYATAEPVLRRVLYQAERSWGPSSYQVTLAAGNLAFIHFAQGEYALARELFEKALSGLQSNPMRAKDEIPLTQAALAVSCAALARRQEANMWLEKALVYAAEELSTEHPAFAQVLERAAITRFFLNDYDSGKKLFDQAVAILESRHGPESQQVRGALERYSGLVRKVKDKSRTGQLKEYRKELEARLRAFDKR
jgi:tetratricopeptide (TPR) repeat protein